MKFSSREDIDAPIDRVFETLCEFDVFERQALRRGAEVRRLDQLTQPGLGMEWQAAFDMRGKRRELVLKMARFEEPTDLGIDIHSAGMEGTFDVTLIALSRTRTRMNVGLELKPRNLPARLLIQSLRLAKSSLNKRFKLRLAEYAKNTEDRLRRSA